MLPLSNRRVTTHLKCKNETRREQREPDSKYRKKARKPGNWKTWRPTQRLKGKTSMNAHRLLAQKRLPLVQKLNGMLKVTEEELLDTKQQKSRIKEELLGTKQENSSIIEGLRIHCQRIRNARTDPRHDFQLMQLAAWAERQVEKGDQKKEYAASGRRVPGCGP